MLDAPFIIEHNDREEGCEVEETNRFNLRFGKSDEDGQIEEEKPEMEMSAKSFFEELERRKAS